MKRILGFIFILVSSLLLVACNGDSSNELRTVSMFGGTDANRGVYSSTLLEFQNEHDVVIKDNSSTSNEEWKASVVASFKNGTEPDVLQFFTGEDAKPFVEAGLVISIEDIRKEYPEYAKNINPAVLDDYAVPTTGFVEGLFTNTAHFKSTAAKAYLEKDAWTWDEFVDLLEILVEDNKDVPGYAPIAYGINIPHYWLDHLPAAALGVNYYEEITGTGGQAKLASALYHLNEIKDYLSLDTTEEISSENFLKGDYTFQLDGSWFAGRIELETIEVFPFPSISDHGTPLLSGFTSGFYITKKAWDNKDKRDLAVKLIQSLTSTSKLSEFVTVGGGFASDSNAKPSEENSIQVALRLLASRTDFNALPLGDSSKSGTYAILVEGQASFVNKQETIAAAAIKEYLDGQ